MRIPRFDDRYLDTFFREKGLRERIYEVEDPHSGVPHSIPTGVVLEHIATTRGQEREQIKNIIRQIDFANGDLHHFFEHLATAIAAQYGQGERNMYSRRNRRARRSSTGYRNRRRGRLRMANRGPEIYIGDPLGTWQERIPVSEIKDMRDLDRYTRGRDYQILNVEGFGSAYSRYLSLPNYIEIGRALLYTREDPEVIEAFVSEVLDPYDLKELTSEEIMEKAESSYSGTFESPGDYAQDFAESVYDLSQNPLVHYVDWERYARDMELEGSVTFVRRRGEVMVFYNDY